MNKTFKGIVVCTMLSSMFTLPTAAFANNGDCSSGACAKGPVAHNQVWDSNCEFYSIPQPAKEECVPTYTSETKTVKQPDITTFEAQEIWTEKVMQQPDIIEYIPHIERREIRVPQPAQKVRVPVITYKEVLVPQPDKIAIEECMVTEKKITKRAPLVVQEKSVKFVPRTDGQGCTEVTLNHPKIERVVTEQDSMKICIPQVEVKQPAGCTPAPAAPAAPCKSSCEAKAPAASGTFCLIKNDLSKSAKFTFSYYMGLKHFTSEYTVEAGKAFTLTIESGMHFKKILMNGMTLEAHTGAELLLSAFAKA